MAVIVLTNYEGRVGLEAARRVLERGGSALDAVEQGIRPVEADTAIKTVGRGGGPNLLGEMECDAAIMDGETLRAGSVGALKECLHAISVARQVLERLPHVMLVGDGALRFGREVGAETADLLTDEAKQKHDAWLAERVEPGDLARWPDVPLARYTWESSKEYTSAGTTAFLAIDATGNICAGTSTSGWTRCYPGRLGDTPIIGAGLYADRRYGACACVGVGEMTIRTGTARSVVLRLQQGVPVGEACREAVDELLDLREGVLGPVVVHAIDLYGNPSVVSTDDLGRWSSYRLWREGMSEPEAGQAEPARSSGIGA